MSQNRFGPGPGYGSNYGPSHADDSSETQWMEYESFDEVRMMYVQHDRVCECVRVVGGGVV